MSDEHLERAKSVVLDLLGWSASGEYLVEYGVLPSAIPIPTSSTCQFGSLIVIVIVPDHFVTNNLFSPLQVQPSIHFHIPASILWRNTHRCSLPIQSHVTNALLNIGNPLARYQADLYQHAISSPSLSKKRGPVQARRSTLRASRIGS